MLTWHQQSHQSQVKINSMIRIGVAGLRVARDNGWPIDGEFVNECSLAHQQLGAQFAFFVVVSECLAAVDLCFQDLALPQTANIRSRNVMQFSQTSCLTEFQHMLSAVEIRMPRLTSSICMEGQGCGAVHHRFAVSRHPSLVIAAESKAWSTNIPLQQDWTRKNRTRLPLPKLKNSFNSVGCGFSFGTPNKQGKPLASLQKISH